MGTGTGPVSGKGTNGSGSIFTESEDIEFPPGHDELKTLLVKNVFWMLAGLGVLVTGLVIVAIIANTGRLSSGEGKEIAKAQLESHKRAACVTELRVIADRLRLDVQATILNQLAIINEYDPGTKKRVPKIINADGEYIPDVATQRVIFDRYVASGFYHIEEAHKAVDRLGPQNLNRLCGKVISNEKKGS